MLQITTVAGKYELTAYSTSIQINWFIKNILASLTIFICGCVIPNVNGHNIRFLPKLSLFAYMLQNNQAIYESL